ncbi:MAG TPA: beta-ketoacyl-[acyl-carrier-protein] synthase family protein [Pirellulales bacterium]|nr:beta-ketoacyl-[acyl-carrier-protein] synthase family protein [Pirellulales bacterium]
MARDIVITGLGVVSPIGVGTEAFWSSLTAGRGGIQPLSSFDSRGMPVPFGAEVVGFDPKEYVKPRKSLKVMSRDIQFGVSAADMACTQAGVTPGAIDPDRFGVVFGADMILCPLEDVEAAYRSCVVEGHFDFRRWGQHAMAQLYPLWMLKYLPNMPACHVAITYDARGPSNSLATAEVSSLLAVAEAARIIERGLADIMVAGGTSSRIHPTTYVRAILCDTAREAKDPATASRPFDAHRCGAVYGEGSGVLVLESRRHAEARGARILGRVLGYSSGFEPHMNGSRLQGTAIKSSIENALRAAEVSPHDVGHVNAHGLSTIENDRAEAQAIRQVLGDVPVTGLKSYFGNLGAGTGAVELAASVLALERGQVPATLNYEHPDPECPVNVVQGTPLEGTAGIALSLNQASTGQAAAIVIAAEK